MSLAQGAPLLSRLVSSSVAIASQAGHVIREVMKKGDLGIVEKESVRDLQTEADRAAQRCIISSLNKCFPKITIIGEEGEDETTVASGSIFDPSTTSLVDVTCPPHLSSMAEEEVVVWVDPLDGTAEYTQAFECCKNGHQGVCKALGVVCSSLLDHVTVLIGIASGGKAIGGIIHQPYYNYQNPGSDLGRTIWGIVGGEVGGMKILPPPEGKLIVTTTRSHSSSTVNDAISAVSPDEVLRVGGAGHKVMLLLEGKAHLYVFASPGCKKWDTCAPQAILEAAGGILTDIQGNAIPYDASAPHRNSTGVLASAAGQEHGVYLEKIPQHVKDNLKA
ncbi:3'(2'),5'-bisphosphate nucleotidase 1 isoform X1 [Penaeus vannamei]|uniref:3'(2'),5'-bisphosphate nucleotidase 1 isoform X1 n=1 Tax=Penaeus vannamei TaxID=6689 RepID=UPI000F66E858|nr:3'(2'),5'-bisphosphate nucleotidase 1-like isoform X1 [Penaeus vannamei]XP_027216536.1 3'(2'),5'-bisphosphate nucleotidase 1-like isoform X1 [Penaeus vannamei]